MVSSFIDFSVSLDEIVKAVHSKNASVEFTMKADAEDYRKTLAVIAEEGKVIDPEPTEALYEDVLG